LQDKDQKSMDVETAKLMLQLLLGKIWPLYPQFRAFIEQSKYKVINRDQWFNILEFCKTVHIDLSNYDVDGACKHTCFLIAVMYLGLSVLNFYRHPGHRKHSH